MLEGVVIIGAGPAGLITALTLVELGYPGDKVTLLDSGKDLWTRIEKDVTGFFGSSRYNYNTLVGESEVGANLKQYIPEEECNNYIERSIDIFKRYNDTLDIPKAVRKSKYKKYTVGEEGIRRTLSIIWVKLHKAGVKLLFETEVNFIQGTLVNYINVREESTLNAEKVVISSGIEHIDYLHHFLDSNNIQFAEDLQVEEDKTDLFLTDINYKSIPGPQIKVTQNFKIPGLENIYIIGSLIGGFSITSAMAQGIKLGEIIYGESNQ